MWNCRRTLQTGLATLLSAAAPLRAFSQPKPRVKVRYNEVVRSMLYTPAYVAIAKGYFDELGMDVTLATAQGGDKSVAIMLSNQADIALIGPELAIYVQNRISPVNIRSSAGSQQPTASCWSGARRSPNLTGACSRARRSWAFGPAARRCSFWRRRCVRTGSIRKRT